MKNVDPILQEISACLERSGIDDAAVREAMIASLLQVAHADNPPRTPPLAEIDQEIWGLCLNAVNQPLVGGHGTDREFDKNVDLELVERLFGSDEVIGVRFRLSQASGDEEVISSTEFDARFGHLDHTAMPDTESLMPDGSSAVCCTNYAHYVRATLWALGHQVQVVGFANEDNPTSRCAIEEFHPGGHDFAIVDSRYLVDPWVRLVAGVEDQIFYDLNDSDDAKKAHEIYGPRSLWLPLPHAEVYQLTEAPKLQNDNQKGMHHDQDNYCYQ